MKIKVDQETCIGCEACVDYCPDVFEMQDDDKSHVIKEDVDAEFEECAKEAIDVCPVGAIS